MSKSMRVVLYAGVLVALLVAVLAFTLNSLAGAEPALAGSRWNLVFIGSEPALPGSTATIEFTKDGKLGGNASCNSYGADYSISGSNIEIGQIASTLMLCADEGLGDQEIRFMAAMESVEQYAVNGDQLLLMDADGQTVLTFNRQ